MKTINVIPPVEDMEHLLVSGEMTRGHLRGKDINRQRVFLARSGPVMNYGLMSAVLLNKVSLHRLSVLENMV